MRVNNLIWDDWNIKHIRRHNIVPKQVNEVCSSKHLASKAYGGRIRIIGSTKKGKVITIILAPKNKNNYYVVTARPASKKERKLFNQEVNKND